MTRPWRSVRLLLSAATLLAALLLLTGSASASTDLALNQPVVASSTFSSSFPATNAVDGNTSTRWAAAQNVLPDTLQVNLGGSYNVTEVSVQWGVDYPTSYQIQVSPDASTWTTVYSTTAGNGGTDDLTGLSGTGQYVRVVGENQNDQWGNSIYNLSVYGTAVSTAPDLALNQPVVGSSTFSSSFPASNAVDGNTSTRWAAAQNALPDTLQVNLGASYAVSEVRIQWGVDYPTSYLVQTSPDASTWTTIYSTTAGNGGTDDLTGLSGTGQYVRVVGQNQNDTWGNSIYTLSVYGTASTAPPPPPPPPPSTGAVVAANPTGPAAPSSGWSVQYANAFGGCIPNATCNLTGAPTDSTLTPKSGAPSNSNEMTWYVPDQNLIDAGGLEQKCTYSPNIATGKNYACGELTSSATSQFHFEPGQGQTWVFQVVAQLPPTTGEEDPAYWFTDPHWTWEIDSPEFWGWHSGSGGKDWLQSNGDGMGLPAVPRTNGGSSASGEADFFWNGSTLTFAPDAALHTYTVEMIGTTFYSWIDGKPMCLGKTIGSVGGWAKVMGNIILQHSLRDPTTGNPSPWFMSGSRTFNVRSIAIYEAASDSGANAQNPVIAPGTTVQ